VIPARLAFPGLAQPMNRRPSMAPRRTPTKFAAAALLLVLCAGAASARRLAGPILVGPRGNPLKALPPTTGGQGPRLVFAVFGSAKHEVSPLHAAQLRTLGQAIASGGDVTLTGACNGKPDAVRSAATDAGGLTVGISAYRTARAHRDAGAPYKGFTVLQLTSLPAAQRGEDRPNLMGREIDEVARADAAIIVGGRTGTLAEFSIAYEEKRPIGVLTGMGEMATVLKDVVRAATRAGKKPAAPVIFDSDPSRLLKRLRTATLRTRALGISGPLGDT
jgi:predicted Rossmann-fold nucleotide-binding protein